jgi:DNA-binding response OmpR family regulator
VDAAARVLVVEDDHDIATPLVRALTADGHEVILAPDGRTALELADKGVDLVLLDLGLPDLDGLEVCRQIRRSGSDVPILVLTGRADEHSAVLGLDSGADDYVAKPFRLAELKARVRAMLRRTEVKPLEVNGVRIDPSARRVFVDEREIDLTPKEYDLLALLVRNAGTVVTREKIMEEVWDEHWFGSTKTLDVHVSWLRRKLGDGPGRGGLITTVRGVGLRFET